MSQILFYDADCGFCQASVDWISKNTDIKLIPYQNVEAIKKYPQIDMSISNDEIQLFYEGRVCSGAEAVGISLKYKNNILYKLFGSLIISSLILPLAKLVYKVVAKNRKYISIFFGLNACKINANK